MPVPDLPKASDVGWTEADWEGLLYAIRHKQCTPFLGAGACAGVLPLGRDIARRWAREYHYPFPDDENLIRVAQYVAVQAGPMTPKFKIIDEFAGRGPPDFGDENEPHRVVADLNLPVYITTNYDDFMVRAIQSSTSLREPSGAVIRKAPRRDHCRWYLARRREAAQTDAAQEPSTREPLVFHLHGCLDRRESMVLTEDDYLDFLMNISEAQDLIPPRIEQAFADSALLFMGYSLEDLNFKVLFRKLAAYMQRNRGARHVSVQLAPRPGETADEQLERAEKQKQYLERHFDLQKVKVYWGTCQDFAADLRTRWERFNHARAAA
ncbi:MAG TPA: SIR2 family protein [Longimicrobium sp.]|nr:SIR2 family protein [Longimicrobium sp.]